MRVLRWMIVSMGVLGGALGLWSTAQAAPLPVVGTERASQAPLVEQARWHGYRRRHWHRRHYGYRRYYGYRRHSYRPRYYRPIYGYRRPYFHRRHSWHRRHYGYRRLY